ncbi:MAG TPA: EamA family transporter [Actinomycetota bacterium]|nr:EamA family transporter [Actinomycetota bacterium]
MASQPAAPSSATLAAFAGAVLIGGSNYIAVKFSNEELDPLWGAALRFTTAAVLLLVICAIGKYPLPRGRSAVGATIYGLLGFGLSYACVYYAVVGLGAGPTAVVLGAVPLATLLLAIVHGQEVLTARGVVGGVLAVAGIAILSLGSLQRDLEPSYVVAALIAVVAIAESSVVIKGFPSAHPMSTNAVGMSVGALFLVIASLLFGQTWALPSAPRTWAALAWLALVGSVGLFWLFLYVIGRWTASASVYALTLMPVVAVLLGSLVADEPITVELVAGCALVLVAVYIGAIGGTKSHKEVEAVPDAGALSAER